MSLPKTAMRARLAICMTTRQNTIIERITIAFQPPVRGRKYFRGVATPADELLASMSSGWRSRGTPAAILLLLAWTARSARADAEPASSADCRAGFSISDLLYFLFVLFFILFTSLRVIWRGGGSVGKIQYDLFMECGACAYVRGASRASRGTPSLSTSVFLGDDSTTLYTQILFNSFASTLLRDFAIFDLSLSPL